MVKLSTSKECPLCGLPMERIKRKQWHRMLSIIFPVQHYECCNQSWLIREKHVHASEKWSQASTAEKDND